MSGAIVIGAGPGIGASVIERFAREGLRVAAIARTTDTLNGLKQRMLPEHSFTGWNADVTNKEQLQTVLEAVRQDNGDPDVVVYNAALIRSDSLGDLSLDEYVDSWRVNVGGALDTASIVLPWMAERGHGTFLVTGGMPLPNPKYVSLSLGKATLRTLVVLLDQQYRELGVHIATVTVAGPVAPKTAFDPDRIADEYWRLHQQDVANWETEIVFTGD